MNVRAVWSAVLVGVLAVIAAGPGAGSAAGGDASSAPLAASVTVRGRFDRVALEGAAAEPIRYVVRGPGQTWWLDGLQQPAPAAGSEVEVTGVQRDAHTLSVDSIRVLSPSDVSLAATAAPRSTRILVVRVFWGTSPPAAPTVATAQQKVISDSQAWFGEVSHGRYKVSGTVTRWLRIPPPQDCLNSSFTVSDQALAAARRAGYQLSSFGRFILYLPCSAGGVTGLGMIPGSLVWLYGTLDKQTVMHEQGHNLGLPHASARICTSRPWGSVTWSSNCLIDEYGDDIDTMGNRQPGHYNAFYKSQLGWLSGVTTVTSSRTVTLAPYETKSRGVKAIRLRAGASTYWLEYRTRTGTDRGMPAGTAGVQIRYQAADGRTHLLDAAPGSTAGFEDFADAHLPAGSSWTTPQRVRITVTRQTASAATVAIRFGAGAPRAPGAPRSVTTRAVVNAARITWTRPADNGSIIRRYLITRTDNGATRTVTTTGGLATSYVWQDLSPARTYAFAVRAINQAGASGATRSGSVRPLTDKPSVVITSPSAGATVRGIVPVRITAAPNAGTRTPISSAQLDVDDNFLASDFTAPWGPFQWDTRPLPDGLHTLEVTVYDQMGRAATVSRRVRVDNPTPTVRITTPTTGATVQGSVNVDYTLAPGNWDWSSVTLLIDGTWSASAQPGQALTFDTSQLTPGSHNLRVLAFSDVDGDHTSPAVSVTVAAPTVTITSPGQGTNLSGQVGVSYTLAPANRQWSYVELFVDDTSWTTAFPGDPLPLDTTAFDLGPHTLRVSGYDWTGQYDSSEVTVTFT